MVIASRRAAVAESSSIRENCLVKASGLWQAEMEGRQQHPVVEGLEASSAAIRGEYMPN